MTDFTSISTPVRLDKDRFQADIPDSWQQGRGVFGGLVLAHLVRAIEAFGAVPDQPLRSLTAELCGPVLPGKNAIHVERLRTGTGVSTIAARIERDGEVLAHAVGVLGRKRIDDGDFCDLPTRVAPPWRDVSPAVKQISSPPAFTRFVEYRVTGNGPFEGSAEATTAGWVRLLDPGPARDAAYVVALADAWWPAIFARMRALRPMATLAFTIELFEGCEGLDPAAPLFHSATAVAARGGYIAEFRELRGEDGRLLALNQQTFVVIK